MSQVFACLYGRPSPSACTTLRWASSCKRGAAGMAAALLLLCKLANAQAVVALDAQVKAAYVHKLPAFVEWPGDAFSTPTSPILIGVVDADAVQDELRRQAAGRSVQGRPIEIKRLAHGSPLPTVHVLFIGSAAPREVQQLLAQAVARPVLTITSSEGGLASGAVLNLTELGGRIRVEASLPSAARNGLKLSSRLLSVASKVVEGPP